MAGAVWLLGFPAICAGALSTHNSTPFPTSRLIIGASWTSRRYGPPSNQKGDILPTIWADDGNQYTMMDDGGTDIGARGGLWRQSMAVVTGTPPHIKIAHVGNPNSPPPHTFAQIHKNRSLWAGPLGPYYSSGLVEAGHVFFATEELDWHWGANGLFNGLHAIAYSTDRGQTWSNGTQSFPPPLGNLSWVIHGQGGVYADGYVYAIATEREFNATRVILGRSRPGDHRPHQPGPVAVAGRVDALPRRAVAGLVAIADLGGADRLLGAAHHLSPDGLRLPAAPLPADVHLLVLEHRAGDLEERI